MRPFLNKTAKTKYYTAFKPILPLVPTKIEEDEKKKIKKIQFELKIRAGSPKEAGTYKKDVLVFDEGTPQEWLDLIRDLNEVWQQNSISGPHDRMSTVIATLKGVSCTTFEAAIEDIRLNPDDPVNALPLTAAHVEDALKIVASIVFSPTALLKSSVCG